ncbi:aspartate/glutamate racemase family protein [Ferrovibrio sp.]|uniref:aspartate/glutamate racemase family protein n=1 Tax=Ferrovibrio sp. TaxID=1917215 RepID=UPI0026101BCC|nr:aspartate/glutamate racemase family protein [Ferrovibrio sp.]
MQTIGLIGGMSWESTAVYYRQINEAVRQRHGGLASAEILLRSVDFSRIVALQQAGRWDQAADELAQIGRQLAGAGAACLLICTNTMHKVADVVAEKAGVPLIHIVDVVGRALTAAGAKRPLLLATRYTMEQDFYRARLAGLFGIDALVPEATDRGLVHDVIFDELCCGVVRPDSRAAYLDVITRGKAAGADAVILGCTEIGLLIGPEHVDLPVFDSTLLHAEAAVDFADGLLLAA